VRATVPVDDILLLGTDGLPHERREIESVLRERGTSEVTARRLWTWRWTGAAATTHRGGLQAQAVE
jgi:hypothetical protein